MFTVSLSKEEREQFLIDLELVAKANKKIAVEEQQLLKNFKDFLTPIRVEKMKKEKGGNGDQTVSEVDPGPTLMHCLYALYIYTAQIGTSTDPMEKETSGVIFSSTIGFIKENEASKRKIFNDAQKWIAAAKRERDYKKKMDTLCGQVPNMIPPDGLDYIVIDLFTSAKADNRYLDFPERKQTIEHMAKTMGVKIQYNGVSHGVHLVGKRAMGDFEGGIEEMMKGVTPESEVEDLREDSPPKTHKMILIILH
jgi:hypothetical protein